MARKRHEDEEDNPDRWLVSYADFITLLFAFFVVMYALSSINEGKYKILSNSLLNAFGRTSGTSLIHSEARPAVTTLPLPRHRSTEAIRHEREQLTAVARNILKVLAPLVDQGKVRVTQTALGVSVEINASVLFASGDAKLSDDANQALKAVAAVLKNDDHGIRVEGHTDSVPIHTAQFPSNWELSAMRAVAVVRLFVENGIADKRLIAVGHGATRPVAANDTPEGRQRNRRVTIMILSNLPRNATEIPVVSAAAH